MWAAEAKAAIDIPLDGRVIKAGDNITITKDREFKYYLWDYEYIWDLPEEYVGKITKIISSQ